MRAACAHPQCNSSDGSNKVGLGQDCRCKENVVESDQRVLDEKHLVGGPRSSRLPRRCHERREARGDDCSLRWKRDCHRRGGGTEAGQQGVSPDAPQHPRAAANSRLPVPDKRHDPIVGSLIPTSCGLPTPNLHPSTAGSATTATASGNSGRKPTSNRAAVTAAISPTTAFHSAKISFGVGTA